MKRETKILLLAFLIPSIVATAAAATLFVYTQLFTYQVGIGPTVSWTVTAHDLGAIFRDASYDLSVPSSPSTTNYAVYTNDFAGKMTVAFDTGYPDAAVFQSFRVEVWEVAGLKQGEFDMTSGSVQFTVTAGKYYYYRFIFTVKATATVGSGTLQLKVSFE